MRQHVLQCQVHGTDKRREQRDALWAEPNGLGNPPRQGRAQTSRETMCTQILPGTLGIRALVNQCFAVDQTAGSLGLRAQPSCVQPSPPAMGWTSQDCLSVCERKAIPIGFNKQGYILIHTC